MDKKQRLIALEEMFKVANMASDPLVGVVYIEAWTAFTKKQRIQDAIEAMNDIIRIARVARTKLRRLK